MRRAAASCVPYVAACLFLSACGFPDYSFAPAKLEKPDSGGGRDAASLDARDAAGSGGASGSGGAGTGGAPPVDAADAHRECTASSDCAASPGGPLCAPEGRCVECRTGFSDCPPGSRCTPEHLCETGCNTNADCVSAPSVDAGGIKDSGAESSIPEASTDARAPVDAAIEARSGATDASSGATDASADADATDAGDSGPRFVCDTVTHTCVGCRNDDDCPLGSSCQAALGRCSPACGPARPCPTGFSCCGGECFNDRHTATHCGGCATSCVEDAGRGACVAGKCQSGLCSQGRGDCNGNARDGCETNLDLDPSNCGTCGHECPTPKNASPICRGGECAVGACNTGFANCDGDLTNACEANLVTNKLDPKNCGTCGFACNLLNANQECVESACRIVNCQAGFSDCDTLPSTGCEVNTRSDPSNCGACGKVCSFPNADSKCANSGCQLGACIPPSVNCNGIASDGCEVNTDSDPDNCGGCAHKCAYAHATATCAGGVCIVESCDTGFADCDGNDSNGCETDLNTNAKNCGACGTPCSTNHGTATCALGACSIQCTGNFRDCDTDASNGCETDTSSNVDTCGSCTKVCPTVGGGAANCVGGVCGISTCSGTLADCNGSASDGCEVETATSVGNCGGCGKACFVANGTAGCAAGACTIVSCAAGFDDCNGDPSDGCEERLNTLSRCGGCSKACALPNANESCITGKCEVASCVSPYADCDGNPSNGCEVDTTSNAANCGGCDNACDTTNGTANCLNGSCSITCNTGFANCNAAVSDGCERVTRNDVNNCGACGAVCAVQNGKPVCNVTTCAIQSCTAPFADCDHAYATGCETNTDTRIDNCGECGHVCDTSKGTPTCTAGVCILPP